jgi:iron complex transport system substrate-binding protein
LDTTHRPTVRQRLAALLAALVVCSAAAPAVGAATGADGPADCSFPVSATDATGTEVTVRAAPERVTTLGPSAAQTMWAVGAERRVVGLTRHAHYLDGAESRTNVSAGFGVSVEAVVGTAPDLVLAPNVVANETVAALREAGLTVFRFEAAASVADVRAKTTLIGRLTGNCWGAARTNAWISANVEAARNATAGRDRPAALYPLGGPSEGAVYVAGGETFADDLVESAGADNVAAARGVTGYRPVSAETVVDAAPDVLVVTTGNEALATVEPFSATPAGEANATVAVDADWLNQPAPRSVVRAVRALTAGFHPDASVAWVDREEASRSSSAGTSAETTDEAGRTAEATGATDESASGFGPAVAAAALALAAALARRAGP